jgi:hypothetical protein
MLVHVSRFKDVHQKVYAQVDQWVTQIKRVLKYRVAADHVNTMLRKLWEDDFAPTSAQIRARDEGRDPRATTWLEVERHLAVAADKIRVQVVNGDMRDAIDYEGNAENGLSLIAIGGDKLSRGLTLEGLSVSYFLRASRMYDSLMQMGRWFGYRPGHIDLCRLYVTPDLELWFRRVASAAEELRGGLDHMAMIGAVPEQFGLRIQSHDILLVTAPNKMRHAREFQVSFRVRERSRPCSSTTKPGTAATRSVSRAFWPPSARRPKCANCAEENAYLPARRWHLGDTGRRHGEQRHTVSDWVLHGDRHSDLGRQ